MIPRLIKAGGVIAILLALGGCGGGGATLRSDISTTTRGQQLIDLKKAYDTGAMTKEEYEREREKVLDSD